MKFWIIYHKAKLIFFVFFLCFRFRVSTWIKLKIATRPWKLHFSHHSGWCGWIVFHQRRWWNAPEGSVRFGRSSLKKIYHQQARRRRPRHLRKRWKNRHLRNARRIPIVSIFSELKKELIKISSFFKISIIKKHNFFICSRTDEV